MANPGIPKTFILLLSVKVKPVVKRKQKSNLVSLTSIGKEDSPPDKIPTLLFDYGRKFDSKFLLLPKSKW